MKYEIVCEPLDSFRLKCINRHSSALKFRENNNKLPLSETFFIFWDGQL